MVDAGGVGQVRGGVVAWGPRDAKQGGKAGGHASDTVAYRRRGAIPCSSPSARLSGIECRIASASRGLRITGDNTSSPCSDHAQATPIRPSHGRVFTGTFAMSLSREDVSRIAHLARLELQADEEGAMLAQLNGFFSIVEQMSAVDTRGVEPLYTPLAAVQEMPLRLRDDVVTEQDRREANQRSAPAVADGLFLVPKVLE